MVRFIVLMLCVFFAASIFAKSPHGEGFKINCATCHTTENWTKTRTEGFNHNTTNFPLVGQHKTVECQKCHQDLIFKNGKTECISCHKDMHEQTLGRDCERCHTPSSWNVNNIIQIHAQSRFPLIGKHKQVDCYQCHNSASRLRFNLLRTECVDCHLNDYNGTTNPSHVACNFSKECTLCHNETSWEYMTFNHNATSFPLTGAHTGVDCTKCHGNGNASMSSSCASCHLKDYNATIHPNHTAAKFSTSCNSCHNVAAWSPAPLFNHTPYFRISSGRHVGINCSTCHTNSANYTMFTCLTSACHGDAHNQNQGSVGCYSCHSKE